MKPIMSGIALCSILVTVLAPPELRVITVFLLLVIPGFVIAVFTFPQKDVVDHIILSVLTGLAFQIVYAYILSLVTHFSLLSLFVPSFLLALLFDFKGRWNPEIDWKTFLIFVPALIFCIATLNLVPGEDANFHLLALGDITEMRAVPHSYILYPEIRVMYPLGFHSLTAQLQIFSGMDNLMFGVSSLISAVLCLSVYWCTKKLFSVECGLLAGVLSVFATFPPLNNLILSTYANLLAYVFACASIGIIAGLDKDRNKDMNKNMNKTKDKTSTKPLFLLSLVLAAGVETHLSFFLIVIPISLFLVTLFIKKDFFRNLRNTRDMRNAKYVLIPFLSLFLSAPFLLRISTGYTHYEISRFLSLWFDPLRLTPQMIPHQIGVWITLISIPGLFLLKKHRILFVSWIGIFLFLALNTILRIKIPLWYIFFATRMVDQLFLPFSILAAVFLVTVWKFSKGGVIVLCVILIISGSLPIAQAPRADRGLLFPTSSPFFATDQEAMLYLLDTDESTTILNEWWTATGSAWIPALTRRRVVFPYIFSLEHYMDALTIPGNERKSFVIAAFPDSEESCSYLAELGVDYIFLSSYVLEESKWRNSLWNPFVLMESPNYELIVNKGYTYIFRVSPDFEYSTIFDLRNFGTFTVHSQEILDVTFDNVSFPVDWILNIHFEDNGWDSIEVRTETSILAVIPRTDTQNTVHAALRIPSEVTEITISVKEPVTMTASVSAAFRDCLALERAALVGTLWKKTPQGYSLENQGHIYLFNTSQQIEITYADTGEGNIDFNIFINGAWEKLTTVYRENDAEEKTILLDVPEGYAVLDIGINNWGDPFILVGIHSVSNRVHVLI